MNQLRYKTLYCKKTNRFICVKYGVLEFVEVPVLYLKYKKFEIENLSINDKAYLLNHSTIKHYSLKYEGDVIHQRKLKKYPITTSTIKLIKENIEMPPSEMYEKFFKEERTYDSLKAIIYRIKKNFYE